ncbi:MAG: thioredoxin [Tepidisphaeraceae bacterium]
MAGKATIEFNDTNFDAEVLKSDKPVVVDFWAEWCQPCRMLGPTIDALATDYTGRVKVGKLDTDSNRNAAMKYQINSIPTVLVFNKGQLVHKFVGLRQKGEFQQVLDGLLKA